MTTIIGIDPGRSGGLAWNSSGEGIQACPMPSDEEQVIKLIREILQANADHRVVAYIELVTGYVVKDKGATCPACKQSIAKGEPGSRMFTFGRGVGVLRGALGMAGIEVMEVSPRTWQKPFYVNLAKQDGQRKSRSERKRILHDIAQRRFPQLQVTLKTADALLIYAYAEMMVGQELDAILAHDTPSVAVPFLQTHSEKFAELKSKLLPEKKETVPGDGTTLFIGNFQGKDCVFKNNGSGATFLHVADAHDLAMLPKGPQ